jgi:hypothetical protein
MPDRYRATSLPTLVVVDPAGKIAAWSGLTADETLRALVKKSRAPQE